MAQQAQATFTLVVQAQLAITTPSIPPAVQGQAYSFQMSASGGNPPYTWSATGLPPGLSISTAGLITGTPTGAGSFTTVVTVNDT